MKTDAGRSCIPSGIRWSAAAVLFGFIFAAEASVLADAIEITSPDHHQTFTYGEMIWHQLYKGSNGELAARITFSNRPYVGDDTPRTDEPFDFHFPGVRFDSARGTFSPEAGMAN